ncbi:hypothetical protein ACFWFI_35225 [Streptomyces sp. NPDC060209]|uniref:hypothetical protein n=1 Tax=Streptomyces sp. NPDC060209 TaxID=3347073 RepID=UPI003646C7CA
MSVRAANGRPLRLVTEGTRPAHREHAVHATPLSIETYSPGDIDEFRTSVTGLLSACAEMARASTDDGAWKPASPDVTAQRDEAFLLLADLSRALNKTRRQLRAINDQARRRHGR